MHNAYIFFKVVSVIHNVLYLLALKLRRSSETRLVAVGLIKEL